MYEPKGLFPAHKSLHCELEICFRLAREPKTSNRCIIAEICKLTSSSL